METLMMQDSASQPFQVMNPLRGIRLDFELYKLIWLNYLQSYLEPQYKDTCTTSTAVMCITGVGYRPK